MAVHTPVVTFRPANRRWAAVEVQTEQHRIVVAIGDADAVVEVHETIILAHHCRAHAMFGELGAQSACKVEREVFFPHAGMTAHSTGIVTAVTGIDEHLAKSARSGSVTQHITGGGTHAADGANCGDNSEKSKQE
jgi:hypothetical protein